MCYSNNINGDSAAFYFVQETRMYEFNHSGHVVQGGSFNPSPLERFASVRFAECPRFLTLARHANLSDTTPIHCYRRYDGKQVDFLVPQQELRVRLSTSGFRYLLVRVMDSKFVARWLVVCEQTRQGFLLHNHILNKYGCLVHRMRRTRQRLRY